MATQTDRLHIFIQAFDKASVSMDGIASKLGTLAAGYLSLQGVMLAYRTAIAAIQEAEAAAAEDVRLSVALRAAGIEAGAAERAIRDLNAELARNTLFTDDAIARAQSYLISIGNLRGAGLERATRAAADLAAAMGTDIVDAARLVAQATDGTSRAFQFLNVAITDTMTPGEKFEALLSAIETKLKGVAVEIADVSPWAQWGKAAGEANESLGRFIGNLVLFRDVGGSGLTINNYLAGFTAALNKLNQNAAGPDKPLEGLRQSAADANAQMVPLIDAMRKLHAETVTVDAEAPSILDEEGWAQARKEAQMTLALLEAWQGPLTEAAQSAEDFAEAEKQVWEGINEGGKQTDEQFVAMRNAAFDVLTTLEAWQGPLTEAEASWKAQHEAINEIVTVLQTRMKETIAVLGAGIARMWIDGELTFGKFIKTVIAGLIEAIVYAAILAALTYGGGGWASYLSAFAGLLGGRGSSGGGAAPAAGQIGVPQGATINFNISGTTDAMVAELIPAIDNAVRRRGFALTATRIAVGVA